MKIDSLFPENIAQSVSRVSKSPSGRKPRAEIEIGVNGYGDGVLLTPYTGFILEKRERHSL